MNVRIGGSIVVIAAVASLRLCGGCSSDNSPGGAGAGGDGSPATAGSGGAMDAHADLPADLGTDHPSSGAGGTPGSGGAGAGGAGSGGTGAGGALGMGGAPGAGGALGMGGSAAGGAPGTGGAAGADAGAGGNNGTGGAMSQTDGSAARDGAIDGSTEAPGDGSTDAPAATLNQIWSTILTVLTPSQTAPGCVGCHDGSDPTIPDYSSTKTTYDTLVGQPSTSCLGTIRVTAGNAETSILVNKLRAKPNLGLGVAVCGGVAMPYGTNQRITLDQLHMIESWINAGAVNN